VPFYRNIWFWLFVGGILGVTAVRPFTRHVPDAPAVKTHVPAFELVDQNGEPFNNDSLTGNVYVVSFFFTSCVTLCPQVMAAMKKLQDRYEKMDVDVRLLSVTVDPDNDTPDVLKAHAQKIGADLGRWTFLTGDYEAIQKLVVTGFKSHMGQAEVSDAGVMDIGHGARFVLVDNKGGIRGNYETTELGLDEIYHRSTHVLRDLKRNPACNVVPHLR